MAWDITGDRVLDSHLNVVVKEIPTTFMATVMKVLEYDQAHQDGIKYIVKIEDTDEVVGLYGGEWLGGSPDAEWGNNENISLEEESE